MSPGFSKQLSEYIAGMARRVQNCLPQTERNFCCMLQLKGCCNACWPQLLLNLQPIASCAMHISAACGPGAYILPVASADTWASLASLCQPFITQARCAALGNVSHSGMMEFKTLMENLQLDTHIVDYGSSNHFPIYFVLQHSSETPGLQSPA